ncbi:MAG TPA: putative toxin-antitoxin system toxin component, PIN family [Rhodocyclaceae bacterium]|nr:putative toxin-antitoxin system toxin component, PIN family [Rhodocyclaceae bacterium]
MTEAAKALTNTPQGSPLRRVVFDTNAILSLWAFTDSRFAPLRAEVNAGRWLALTRPDCLDELRRVLTYPQFKFDAERQAAAYAAYGAQALCWQGDALDAELPRCKDRDDQKFLELARDAGAHWLVTSDKLLLRCARRQKLAGMFQILKPEVLLAELVSGAPPFALSVGA